MFRGLPFKSNVSITQGCVRLWCLHMAWYVYLTMYHGLRTYSLNYQHPRVDTHLHIFPSTSMHLQSRKIQTVLIICGICLSVCLGLVSLKNKSLYRNKSTKDQLVIEGISKGGHKGAVGRGGRTQFCCKIAPKGSKKSLTRVWATSQDSTVNPFSAWLWMPKAMCWIALFSSNQTI